MVYKNSNNERGFSYMDAVSVSKQFPRGPSTIHYSRYRYSIYNISMGRTLTFFYEKINFCFLRTPLLACAHAGTLVVSRNFGIT